MTTATVSPIHLCNKAGIAVAGLVDPKAGAARHFMNGWDAYYNPAAIAKREVKAAQNEADCLAYVLAQLD